jgi:hypothetical protein
LSASIAFLSSSYDKQYLTELALGNEAALEALFTRYYAGLLRYSAKEKSLKLYTMPYAAIWRYDVGSHGNP